ncbi:DUF3710 domain-containing protein [Pseudonocardia sp. CA-142604]|uniref:DUF3710 domain-containing protein n=1 Tax=Pseudonocardia sp. CA-142604 TaxID=3240024 RepID=UPI003D92025E
MARRNRLAVATEQALDEPRGGGALALDQREDGVDDSVEDMSPGVGPYDGDDLDPEATDASGVVDFGAVQVPVPKRGTVAVEPTANGRMQAVHVALPEGRLSVSALAAPKSSKLWPELAREIDTSLREGGATVRSFPGPWGRELHANSGGAKSVFIGVDGPRWMLYGVATGPADHAETLDFELRRMLRATVVVRGRAPYPVRTVLPLVVPEPLAEAMAAAAAAKAEAEAAQAQEEAAAAASSPAAASAPSGAVAVPSGAPERPVQAQAPTPPVTEQSGAVRLGEQSGAVRPAPRPRQPGRPGPAPREVAPPAAWNQNGYTPQPGAEIAAPGRDRNGQVPRPDAGAGAPLWADPVQRIADVDDGVVAGREPDDFADAPTEIWGPLPPDPAEQAAANRTDTGSWRPVARPNQVQESGGHQRTSGSVGGFPTQPWALDPRMDDAPESWASRADRPELARGHASDPGMDAPTDPWPLADGYHAGPAADGPADAPWSRGRNGHVDGDVATPRRRAAESEQSRPDLRAVPEPVDPAPSGGGRRALREDRLVETGEYAAPTSSGYYETPGSGERSEYGASRGYGDRSDYGEQPDPTGQPEYGRSSGYAAEPEYAAPSNSGRWRAVEPSDDVVDGAAGGEWHTEVREAPFTQEFSFVTDADPPAASAEFARRGRGRHAAPEAGDGTPVTMPLKVFVPPVDRDRPSGRHRRPD